MAAADSPGDALGSRLRYQETIAELGRRDLGSDDLDGTLAETAATVRDALEVAVCSVLELRPDGEAAVVRAGDGRDGGPVGTSAGPADDGSWIEDVLAAETPVADDPDSFTDCDGPGLGVAIEGPAEPWGVLVVRAASAFVASVADLLASAIENHRRQPKGPATDAVADDVLETAPTGIAVDDVLADLEVLIDETDAEVDVESLPRIERDPDQLRQLFPNLIDNAITYSGDRTPRISVFAEYDGTKWKVSVRDRGIGIDPNETDRIFRVFDRLHGREEYAGTGIGLALRQRIAERHGGGITADSVPGEGSPFTVALSAVPEHDSPTDD